MREIFCLLLSSGLLSYPFLFIDGRSLPQLPFVNRRDSILQMCRAFQECDGYAERLSSNISDDRDAEGAQKTDVPAASPFFGAGKTYLGQNVQQKLRQDYSAEELGISKSLHGAICDALYVLMDISRTSFHDQLILLTDNFCYSGSISRCTDDQSSDSDSNIKRSSDCPRFNVGRSAGIGYKLSRCSIVGHGPVCRRIEETGCQRLESE